MRSGLGIQDFEFLKKGVCWPGQTIQVLNLSPTYHTATLHFAHTKIEAECLVDFSKSASSRRFVELTSGYMYQSELLIQRLLIEGLTNFFSTHCSERAPSREPELISTEKADSISSTPLISENSIPIGVRPHDFETRPEEKKIYPVESVLESEFVRRLARSEIQNIFDSFGLRILTLNFHKPAPTPIADINDLDLEVKRARLAKELLEPSFLRRVTPER